MSTKVKAKPRVEYHAYCPHCNQRFLMIIEEGNHVQVRAMADWEKVK